MNDLRKDTRFYIEVSEVTAESICKAIEDKYYEWRTKLSHQGAGVVRVTCMAKHIATGSLIWWWDGTHTIRLEPANTGRVERTSVCPKYSPPSEHGQKACS